MQSRGFLKAIPAAAMLPAVQSAPRLKIADIRVVALKTIRETGTMEAAWNPGTSTTQRIGGGSFTEIRTDQGLTGIGPGMDAASVPAAKVAIAGQGPLRHRTVRRPAALLRGSQLARGLESRDRPLGSHRQGGPAAALQALGGGQGTRARVCQHDSAIDTRRKGADGCRAQSSGLESHQAAACITRP